MKTLKSLYLTFCLVCLINFAYAAMLGTPEIIILLVVCILLMVPIGLIVWLIVYLVKRNNR